MMVDGEFDELDKFKIQNADCILMFFRLLSQRETAFRATPGTSYLDYAQSLALARKCFEGENFAF